jgi:hypothetical protein
MEGQTTAFFLQSHLLEYGPTILGSTPFMGEEEALAVQALVMPIMVHSLAYHE